MVPFRVKGLGFREIPYSHSKANNTIEPILAIPKGSYVVPFCVCVMLFG